MHLQNDKDIIRKEFLKKRILFKRNFTSKNKLKLILNLNNLLKDINYKSIAGYYPIGSEIDCLTILEKEVIKNKLTALPFVKKDNKIEFRKWKNPDTLIRGLNNIPVPKNKIILSPDIILTPLLSFDLSGVRLGFGSGVYDRSFPNFPFSKKIGLAFSGQLNKRKLPNGQFDYKLDAVITEKDIFVFK